ncbi:uncharacterized protein LOC110913752 [Helianthus annuus]|uniref:uncharacterized protein LOC110913752 n=1 Tax=Helianthus annuus TaxID=4232 RepID=UPI000B901986|nr:uncharacterized protein LOC110913752 [Helianthus annuus]
MSKRGVEIGKNLVCKVGAGDKTMFWIDVWSGEIPFRERFPLLYDLAKNKRAKVVDHYKRLNDGILWEWAWLRVPNTEAENHQAEGLLAVLNVTTVSAGSDNWIWKGKENEEFAVKSIRNTLSRNLNLNEPTDNYFWNNWAAKKCSTFAWRALKGRIPTATQLRQRGVPIPSDRCRLCDQEEEMPNHALVKCREANGVWEQIGCWVKAETITQQETLGEMFDALEDYNWPKKKKKMVHAILLLTTWVIWKNRNEKIFRGKSGEIFKMVEEIKEESFQWMKHKSKLLAVNLLV